MTDEERAILAVAYELREAYRTDEMTHTAFRRLDANNAPYAECKRAREDARNAATTVEEAETKLWKVLMGKR
jgi:hypothetical protein